MTYIPGGGGGGSGSVTTVSVITANGVSGSVANATTTPAITLSLGAITPSSVASGGSITGTNLSGTNTGDQTSVSGNAGTATALASGRTIGMTGDLVWTSPSFNGTSNVTAAGTLATVNANVGTFGSSSLVPVVTVNAKGLVTAVSTATLTASVLNGLATATVPTAQLEWTETLAATGVTGSSRIFLGLAPTVDSDENDIETLNLVALAGTPGTNTITVTLAFGEPTSGPIKLNWSAV